MMGWRWLVLAAAVYLALFVANLWVPLVGDQYPTRATRGWSWTLDLLTLCAMGVVLVYRSGLRSRDLLAAATLALTTGLSAALHSSRAAAGEQALATALCLLAAIALSRRGTRYSAALPQSVLELRRSLLVGCLVGLPLALLNNAYFALTVGPPQIQTLLGAAALALSPAIHEEVVFRCFVLAACGALLGPHARTRAGIAASLTLAVVPHSLNHLPDVVLAQPAAALALLAATSALFGLPMALLQLRRDLPAAIALHWTVDALRFVCGY